MAQISTLSSNSVIQRIQTRFKPNFSSWQIDAIDWIGEAIKEIGYNVGFKFKKIPVRVKNYRASIPREIKSIEAVYYNGYPLVSVIDKREQTRNYHANFEYAGDSQVEDLAKERQRLSELNALLIQQETDGENTTETLLAIENSLGIISRLTTQYSFKWYLQSFNEWYDIEAGTIKTSIPSCEIVIWGNCMIVDEDGFPLIVNSEKYIKAVEWYIIYNMMLQGWEHPAREVTLEYAERKCYYELIPSAQNEKKQFSRDEMENFTAEITSIKRDGQGVTLTSDI